MEEVFFYNNGIVSVSNARFIVHGQTYAMNGVTSVKQMVWYPSRMGPGILILLGLLIMLAMSLKPVLIGGAIAGLGIFWWTRQKPTWSVVLNSSSGETQALRSQDRSFIDAVIGALNQSIVHRG